MTDVATSYCATDKELFDVFMGSKRRFSSEVMHGLAARRGLFYSSKEDRKTLAEKLALLPYAYCDLESVMAVCEQAQRAEKVSHVTISSAATASDLQEVARGYAAAPPIGEIATAQMSGPNNVVLLVNYSEIDYTKNRLLQRREKQAEVEFVVENGATTIRMPANDKAREIVATVIEKLGQREQKKIEPERIELAEISDPEYRTRFFTDLMAKMPSFLLRNVTSLKVEKLNSTSDIDDFESHNDDEEFADEQAEMLSVIRSVVIKGDSLLLSPEYHQLRDKGFFITGIVWRASLRAGSSDLVEFEAGFEDSENSTGFRYNIRGVALLKNDRYMKTFRAPTAEQRQLWFAELEKTAGVVLKVIKDDYASSKDHGKVT